MTYTQLLKILEGDADVSQLNEENIAEYKQAKQTIDTFNRFVIDPFKEFAKGRNETVYDTKDVKITARQVESEQRHPDKTLLTLLQSHLQTALTNHKRGKQAYGVRTFDDVPAIDAVYTAEIFNDWQEEVLGTTISDKIHVKGGKEIAKTHMGRLATIFNQGYQLGEELTPDQASLYIAAAAQVDALQRRIVKPFETAFKSLVKEQDETTVIRKPYGGLIVEVKDVPRLESDYKSAVRSVQSQLEEYAGLQRNDVDNTHTFFNADLIEPRAYVHIPALQNQVQVAQNAKEQKHKKEIAILYKPEEAAILSA